ncbi:hypothetical protein JCM9279_005871 [Rhodotorula babjevae]
MAPAGKPEEIYSHPPPFAPPPPVDEPLFPENSSPNGLLYLVKFKGSAATCDVPAEYFLNHQDLVDAYWKRDDVPHHERHPWGSKELIEGKKLYDEKPAAAAKEEEERRAAAAAAAAGEGEPKELSSPESESTSSAAEESENEEE